MRKLSLSFRLPEFRTLLTINTSSAGSIYYKGDADDVSAKTSSAGSIIKK